MKHVKNSSIFTVVNSINPLYIWLNKFLLFTVVLIRESLNFNPPNLSANQREYCEKSVRPVLGHPSHYFFMFFTYFPHIPSYFPHIPSYVYMFFTYSFMGSCNRRPARNFSKIFQVPKIWEVGREGVREV